MKQKIVLMLALLTFSWVQINAQQQFFTPDEIITKVKAGTDVKGLAMKVTLVEQGSTQFKVTNVSEGSSVILNRGDNQELTAAGTFDVTIVTFVAGSGTNANVYTLTCKLYVAPKEPEPESPCNRHYESAVKFIVDTPVVHTFTVNGRTGAKVIFSSGNLQYRPSTNEWRFALRQFDRCGTGKSQHAPEGLKATTGRDSNITTVFYDSIDYSTKDENGNYKVIKNVPCNNLLISKTYQGWVDMFGYGTSGQGQKVGDKGTAFFYPYEISNPAVDFGGSNPYGYGPSWDEGWGEGALSNNIDKHSGTNRLFDWGYANYIREYNGSVFDDEGHYQYSTDSTMYHKGIWRTLTLDEWKYMMLERKVGDNDSAFSYVRLQWGKNAYDTVSGIIIYPDDFKFAEAGVAPLNFGANYSLTQITLATWEALQEAGCVFLPASHFINRSNGLINFDATYTGCRAFYWASTVNGKNGGYLPYFNIAGKAVNLTNTGSRYYGFQVRLVQDYFDPCGITEIKIKDTTVLLSVRQTQYEGTAFGTGKTYKTPAIAASAVKQRFNVDTLRTAELECDSVICRITVKYPEFTINANGDKATFSPGNLAYQGSTGNWRWQDPQYYRTGAAQNSPSASTTFWMDVFGWGTSGASGKRAPYYINTTATNYNWSDWGSSGKSIGRYSSGTWRTPSKDEWRHILVNRIVDGQDSAFSVVRLQLSSTNTDTVSGIIIYPDDFTWEKATKAGVTKTLTYGQKWQGTHPAANLSKADWEKLELLGCVFLPGCGYRNPTNMAGGSYGLEIYYWTSTPYDGSNAYRLRFSLVNGSSSYAYIATGYTINNQGCAVRLIRNLPKDY